MLNGCKTTKPSLPDRPGKMYTTRCYSLHPEDQPLAYRQQPDTRAHFRRGGSTVRGQQLTIVPDDIDGQKRKKYTEVGADQ